MERKLISGGYRYNKSIGVTYRDIEKETRVMCEYFNDLLPDELEKNAEVYNISAMCELVKEYFCEYYSYDSGEITLNTLCQDSINSKINIYDDNPDIIHIDELLQSTVVSFFILMFKWSKDCDDVNVYSECFVHVLYLFNEVCIASAMHTEGVMRKMLALIQGDLQILQLAESCYWTVVVFTLAHEIAHQYLQDMKSPELRNLWKKDKSKLTKKERAQLKQDEFEADEIAYDIVLKMLQSNEGILEKYSYLAPMMYMDFFDLYYYTDRVLYKQYVDFITHPMVGKRKNYLFAIVNRPEYNFDTVEGNHVYNGFLDVFDEYKDQLLLKEQRGKLEGIKKKCT